MIGVVDAGFCLGIDRTGVAPIEYRDKLVCRHQRMQLGNDLAVRGRIGASPIVGIFVIETDAVESVFCHGMGQNLGERVVCVLFMLATPMP